MEAISATVSSAAVREAAAGLPRLTPGQVVTARVTRVEGANVELRLGQHNLQAASRVPLEVGDQVELEVQRSATGGILLRMVDDARGKGGQRQSAAAPASPGTTSPPGSQPTRAESGPTLSRPPGPPPGPAGLARPAPPGENSFQPTVAATVRTYERLSGELVRLVAGPLSQPTASMSVGGRLSAPFSGQTRPGGPTASADLLGLLSDLGLPADPATLGLVEALVRQGAPLGADAVRGLRRQLAALGGEPADAQPLALLSRLGLPRTSAALELARLLVAGGQAGLPERWGEALVQLERLARGSGDQPGDAAPSLAQRALQAWQAPGQAEPPVLARWLQATLQDTATPTEARLALLLQDGRADVRLDQDARVRLAELLRAVEQAPAGRTEARQALDRLQSALQAEQLLNSARPEPREPRFFVFTLPTAQPERRGTLELAVREREPGQPVGPGRPDYLRLRLELPNLGQVRVNLTVNQPSLSCHFAAETPSASALLQAGADELLAGFRRLGYHQASVDAAVEAGQPDPIWAPTPSTGRVHRVDLRA